jgi:hypothetical protein
MDYVQRDHKVAHVQVLVTKPIERRTRWDPTEWVSVQFNAATGILDELVEKRIPLDHFPPSRFDRGSIEAQVGRDQDEPWKLFGHEEVFAVKIFYDEDRFTAGTGSLEEHAHRLEAYMRRALERKYKLMQDSRLMLALLTVPPRTGVVSSLANIGDSLLSVVGKFLW